ncbi:MAG: hypothetical protein WDZ41_05610 [Candidatus Babeliales bacterium]
MKKLLLALSLFMGNIYGEFGCMDNSKHLDTRTGPDFKNYHYVSCTCPCYRYKQSFKRGRCEECLHYRAPRGTLQINTQFR